MQQRAQGNPEALEQLSEGCVSDSLPEHLVRCRSAQSVDQFFWNSFDARVFTWSEFAQQLRLLRMLNEGIG